MAWWRFRRVYTMCLKDLRGMQGSFKAYIGFVAYVVAVAT